MTVPLSELIGPGPVKIGWFVQLREPRRFEAGAGSWLDGVNAIIRGEAPPTADTLRVYVVVGLTDTHAELVDAGHEEG